MLDRGAFDTSRLARLAVDGHGNIPLVSAPSNASHGRDRRPPEQLTGRTPCVTPLPSDPRAALSREQLGDLAADYHRQRGW